MQPYKPEAEIPNAAVDLYEIGIDLYFERWGHLCLDSSLGLLATDEEPPSIDPGVS